MGGWPRMIPTARRAQQDDRLPLGQARLGAVDGQEGEQHRVAAGEDQVDEHEHRGEGHEARHAARGASFEAGGATDEPAHRHRRGRHQRGAYEEGDPALGAGPRQQQRPEREPDGGDRGIDRHRAPEAAFLGDVAYPGLPGDPQEAERHPQDHAQPEPDVHVDVQGQGDEYRRGHEQRPEDHRRRADAAQQGGHEGRRGEDAEVLGGGVDADGGLVDAVALQDEREQRQGHAVDQRRHGQRHAHRDDGADACGKRHRSRSALPGARARRPRPPGRYGAGSFRKDRSISSRWSSRQDSRVAMSA